MKHWYQIFLALILLVCMTVPVMAEAFLFEDTDIDFEAMRAALDNIGAADVQEAAPAEEVCLSAETEAEAEVVTEGTVEEAAQEESWFDLLAPKTKAGLAKATTLAERLSCFTEYLSDKIDDGYHLPYVGLVDMNRDTYPELLYIRSEKNGMCYLHICNYVDEDVEEYTVEDRELGKKVKEFSLIRRRKGKTTEHCWVLQYEGKDSEKWNQKVFKSYFRNGDVMEATPRFLYRWKKKKKEYYVDDTLSTESIYDKEMDKFNEDWPVAYYDKTKQIIYKGVFQKVKSPKKEKSVRTSFSKAVDDWYDLLESYNDGIVEN